MSRSNKTGKGYRHVNLRASRRERSIINNTHRWGSTHRILRRNRKFWSQKLGKIRRIIDKLIIKESLKENGSKSGT